MLERNNLLLQEWESGSIKVVFSFLELGRGDFINERGQVAFPKKKQNTQTILYNKTTKFNM